MTVTMNVALIIFRLVVGLTLAGHGAQKLFGWFGGPGPARLRQGFQQMGYTPVWLWVGLAIVGEVGGGISLALGLLTPLGAAGIFGTMVMAMLKNHWKNGFWLQKGGYEYTLVLVAASITIGLIGPGGYSLDALLRIALPEPLVFGILALAALLVDVVGIISTHHILTTRSESTTRASS
jgi:putative oxidoreductase